MENEIKELEVDAKTQRVIEAIEKITDRMVKQNGVKDKTTLEYNDEQRAIYDDLLSVHEYLKYGVGDLS